jgi:negative regulator of genetic competence, sporulation and motility
MKIKIRIEKKHLQYLVACGAMLYKLDQSQCTEEMIIDFDNLRNLITTAMMKHSSSIKKPLLSFDANYFLSFKRILERSGVTFDEYYQILLTEFITECNHQIMLHHVKQTMLLEIKPV